MIPAAYLCVGLAHALVQGLVVVDGGLQHLDVAVHRLDLTASRPAVHVLNILKIVRRKSTYRYTEYRKNQKILTYTGVEVSRKR